MPSAAYLRELRQRKKLGIFVDERKQVRDITGLRSGMLQAIALSFVTKGRPHWKAVCDCGNVVEVFSGNLLSGHTKSCGCNRHHNLPKMHALNTRHGHAVNIGSSRTYNSWSMMKARCQRPNATGYSYYGGRGVIVCERWHKFENFLADMGERPDGKTLDRINPYGNYTPDNCKWSTYREQTLNRRSRFALREQAKESNG
jgi:hypothetical protein